MCESAQLGDQAVVTELRHGATTGHVEAEVLRTQLGDLGINGQALRVTVTFAHE
jgi:hypothetical protein